MARKPPVHAADENLTNFSQLNLDFRRTRVHTVLNRRGGVAKMQLNSSKQNRRGPDPALLSLPGTRGRRPERTRDRAAKQQALLSAAKRLFAQRGYDATTTREIAAQAGCAEGLIHRYFKGKAGLFLALIQHRDSQIRSQVSRTFPQSSKFDDEILRLVEAEIDHMWEDREFLKVIIPRALHDPSVGKIFFRVATSRSTSAVVERLRRLPDCAHMGTDQLEAYARLVDLLGFSFGFLRPVLMGQDHLEAKKSALRLAKTLVRQHTAA